MLKALAFDDTNSDAWCNLGFGGGGDVGGQHYSQSQCYVRGCSFGEMCGPTKKASWPTTLLIRSRHTSATLCGGCVVGCGQSVVASHTWPAPWLQGPATKLWHHNLTTKPATFLVGLWCKCGGCVGQLCGGVVVGLWACTPPHPPHTIATPALPHSSCFRPPHFMFNVSPPPHPTPRTH